jgi:[protein-PII] uridylyltransferase
VSRDFTVLEIVTEDRAGVLYAMTRTLFNESLDIHRSKIATEANRAIDVFYVRDKANLVKITDPERMVRLKTTLLDLLAER